MLPLVNIVECLNVQLQVGAIKHTFVSCYSRAYDQYVADFLHFKGLSYQGHSLKSLKET